MPIPSLDLNNPKHIRDHTRLVSFVETMIALNAKLITTKSGDSCRTIERLIEATDTKIDRLVYELYGLTEDEIRIVEEATSVAT